MKEQLWSRIVRGTNHYLFVANSNIEASFCQENIIFFRGIFGLLQKRIYCNLRRISAFCCTPMTFHNQNGVIYGYLNCKCRYIKIQNSDTCKKVRSQNLQIVSKIRRRDCRTRSTLSFITESEDRRSSMQRDFRDQLTLLLP